MLMLLIVRQTNEGHASAFIYLLLDMEYIFFKHLCAFALNTLNSEKSLHVDCSRINQHDIRL